MDEPYGRISPVATGDGRSRNNDSLNVGVRGLLLERYTLRPYPKVLSQIYREDLAHHSSNFGRLNLDPRKVSMLEQDLPGAVQGRLRGHFKANLSGNDELSLRPEQFGLLRHHSSLSRSSQV